MVGGHPCLRIVIVEEKKKKSLLFRFWRESKREVCRSVVMELYAGYLLSMQVYNEKDACVREKERRERVSLKLEKFCEWEVRQYDKFFFGEFPNLGF
jgi:hypothetical protein